MYFLSFTVIGALWLAHHRLFNQVARSDEALMSLNLLFLMVVAALPFPTAVLARYGSEPSAVVLYAASMAVAGTLLMLLTVLADRRRLLLPGSEGGTRRGIWLGGTMVAVFVLSIPLALVAPTVTPLTWLVMLPLRFASLRRLRGSM